MDKKETPIKCKIDLFWLCLKFVFMKTIFLTVLISSAIKSQSTPSLVNPLIRTSPLVTDLFKSTGIQPKSSESVLNGHRPVSSLTLCFGGRTATDVQTQTQTVIKCDIESQTETVIKCEIQSQTDLLLCDKETQTEVYTNDLSLPKVEHLAEMSTQTEDLSQKESDLSHNESDLEKYGQISSIDSNQSDQCSTKLCENSSQTESRSSTLSQVS